MKYRITNISPFKAAISVMVIRLIGVTIAASVALYTKYNGEIAMHNRPKIEESFNLFYDLIGPIFLDSISIFVSTFIAFFIFNKLCHYWGGIEITLKEKQPL